MGKLDFDVALGIRECPDLHNAADGVLPGFRICDDQHLADRDRCGHPQNRAMREHNHGARLLFEGLGVRRDFAHNLGDA